MGKTNNVSRQRQNVLVQPRKTILSGQKPSELKKTPLTWRVRQYITNDGAAREPLQADINTFSTEYYIQTYRGFISDDEYAQYTHKAYSVRLKADQAVTMPVQLFWQKNLAIISTVGATSTVEYTAGTDDNLVERLDIDLDKGINDLHILTYAGVADQRLEIILDLTSIHSSMIPVSSKAEGRESHVDNPDAITDTVITLLDVDSLEYPSGVTVIGCSIKTNPSSTYSVAFKNYSDPATVVNTIETVATSGSQEASDDGTIDNPDVAVGNIIYAVLPATDVDSVFVKVRFTKD